MRLREFSITAALVVPSLCALIGLAVLVFDPSPIQTIRNAQFDQFQRWQPRIYVPVPVRIIDIDDASVARLGQWPWPRTRLAELVNKLRDAGAAAIGFDIVFAEADRTSPKAIAALWGAQNVLASSLSDLPDHDEVFAKALAPGGVVLGFALNRAASVARDTQTAPSPPYRFIQVGPSSSSRLHSFQGAVRPLPAFEAAAAGLGAVSFVPDSDGVVRRVPLAFQVQTETVPSLIAETLRVGQNARNYVLKAESGENGLQEIRIGSVTVPTTPRGEVWVHYSKPVSERYIPAWKVLAGIAPQAQLDGHLVLIGASAQGLQDLRFSPLGRIIPGVEAHAQALEQILSGAELNRPAWAIGAEAVVLALGCLIVGVLAQQIHSLIAAGITVVIVGSIVLGGWLMFSHEGLLLDAIVPAWAVGLTFMFASLIHHFISERQQRWVRGAFSRYVSPNLVQYLVSHPRELELGGQRRECSFVFTDLAGFTTLMETIDPAEAVSLLNAYLDQMIAIAFRHQGTLDRIVGDAVAIMFSAPLQQPDHQQKALNCALEMDRFATGYSKDLRQRGIAFGLTRVGVHSGEVIVGNFGGSTIFDYRALGDVVNTASRLESVNKHLGTRICVSAATLSGCANPLVRPVGRLVLKGKALPLEVFEPIDTNREEERARPADYGPAYAKMKNDEPDALEAFARLSRLYPDDPLVSLHLVRLSSGEHGDLIVMNEK